jgi:hypothetical protein
VDGFYWEDKVPILGNSALNGEQSMRGLQIPIFNSASGQVGLLLKRGHPAGGSLNSRDFPTALSAQNPDSCHKVPAKLAANHLKMSVLFMAICG